MSVALVEEVQTPLSVAHTRGVEFVSIRGMQTNNSKLSRVRTDALRFSGCSEELYGIERVMLEVQKIRWMHTDLRDTHWMLLAQ